MLSDREILQALDSGKIKIDGFDRSRLNPNSYDVLLSEFGLSRLNATPAQKWVPGYGDTSVRTWVDGCIDPYDKSSFSYSPLGFDQDGAYIMKPDEFIIGAVFERSEFIPQPEDSVTPDGYLDKRPNVVSKLNGKSSLARLGLLVHVTAGLGDVGWGGHYILELKNLSGCKLKLHKNMPIAQLEFYYVGIVDRPYGHEELNSKYQDQKPGQGSLYPQNKGKNTYE